MKTVFEANGLRYIKCGEYFIPDLGLTEQERKYGIMRKKYLEENQPGLYTKMILSGKLYEHLAEIDQTCRSRLEQMIPQMAKAEGVTESLKAENQMLWVGKMNALRASAEEILSAELIFN